MSTEYLTTAVEYFNGKLDYFKEKYNPNSLRQKVSATAKQIGATGVYYVLLLFYALSNESIPIRKRIMVLAALGYYISPLDFIPDFMIAGLLDDTSILLYVVHQISSYIDDDVKSKARAKLIEWFGKVEISDEKTESDDSESVSAVSEEIAIDDSSQFIENKKGTDMFLFVSLKEISAYIGSHFNKEVLFSKVSDNELRVSVTQNTIVKDIRLNINIRLEEVASPILTLSYHAGLINMIIPNVLSHMFRKRPELKDAITTGKGKRIFIDLQKIDGIKTIFDYLTLENLAVEETGLKISATIK